MRGTDISCCQILLYGKVKYLPTEQESIDSSSSSKKKLLCETQHTGGMCVRRLCVAPSRPSRVCYSTLAEPRRRTLACTRPSGTNTTWITWFGHTANRTLAATTSAQGRVTVDTTISSTTALNRHVRLIFFVKTSVSIGPYREAKMMEEHYKSRKLLHR